MRRFAVVAFAIMMTWEYLPNYVTTVKWGDRDAWIGPFVSRPGAGELLETKRIAAIAGGFVEQRCNDPSCDEGLRDRL